MDTTYERNLEWFCRTCMYQFAKATVTSEPKRHWQFIFDTDTEFGKLSIAELLSKSMPQIKVDLNDERLPTKICNECLLQLRNSYRFQMMCLRTDQQLHELLANSLCCINEKKAISEIVFSMEETPLEIIDRVKTSAAADPLLHSIANDIVVGQKYVEFCNIDEFIKDEHCGDDAKRSVECDGEQEIFHSTIDIKEEIFEAETTDEHKSIESLLPNTHTKNSGEQNEIFEQEKESTDQQYVLKCDLCNRYFKKTESFDKHRLAHMKGDKEGLDIYPCEICSKTYSTRAILKRHEKEVHLRTQKRKRSKCQCIICEKILETSMLQDHMCTHTAEEETSFPDRHTKNSAEQNEIIEQEKESTDQQYGFKCDMCNRYFYKAESLQKHRLAHEEEDKLGLDIHSCELCGKIYSTPGALKRHEKEVHLLTQEEQYKCKFCKKSLENSLMFKDHMRTHIDDRQHLCPECGKSFKSKGNLNEHRKRHIDAKLNECPHCPKTFNCISDLTKHKAIHKGIKRHVCDICGKAFIKRYELTGHKLYHSDERPYKCDYCEMRFHRVDNQRTHMRKHTGEKPYKCKYCERAFSQSNDRVKHLRSHLGENVYWCELCPATFRLMSELRLHFATHKNEDPETRERNLKALKEAEAEIQLKLMNKAESR